MPPISISLKHILTLEQMFWLNFSIQWPKSRSRFVCFLPNHRKNARLVTCWRRWRKKVRNPMFLGPCTGRPQTPWLIVKRVFDTCLKWNLWSRFTSAVHKWKKNRIGWKDMESMYLSSQNHWSFQPISCCEMCWKQSPFIRDHLLQRCLKCCGRCAGWFATLLGDDPRWSTSLGWCKRLGRCFW